MCINHILCIITMPHRWQHFGSRGERSFRDLLCKILSSQWATGRKRVRAARAPTVGQTVGHLRAAGRQKNGKTMTGPLAKLMVGPRLPRPRRRPAKGRARAKPKAKVKDVIVLRKHVFSSKLIRL